LQQFIEHSSASPCDAQTPFLFPGATGVGDARNIFYEQQLARKEKDITELRNAVHVAELNVRDIQQASLTKDLQHFEMVEKLKDEIRILEGWLFD
uniref:IF rod domain-containing protein n=1 Tax=Gongylonema pulchrum TaxID=637853 RepID=A0A183F1E3_9BILA